MKAISTRKIRALLLLCWPSRAGLSGSLISCQCSPHPGGSVLCPLVKPTLGKQNLVLVSIRNKGSTYSHVHVCIQRMFNLNQVPWMDLGDLKPRQYPVLSKKFLWNYEWRKKNRNGRRGTDNSEDSSCFMKNVGSYSTAVILKPHRSQPF